MGARRRQVAPRKQPAGRVAERHPDDGERAEELRVRLGADEERHADESDPDAEEPPARDALVVEKAEREHRVEDRHRRLDDRGEPGVDPRLAPREEPERDRRVEQADDDEPAASAPAGRRRPRGRRRAAGTTMASVSAASPSRPRISVDGLDLAARRP